MLTARTTGGKLMIQLVLTLLTIPFVLPLIAMVQGSLAGTGWNNYRTVLSVPQLPGFFKNSIIIAICTVALVYVVGLLAAFGFSKLRIPGKEFFFWLILAALTLPGVVMITPLFKTASTLNLLNTYPAVVLPLAALQIPFAVLIARNFVNGIPDEIIDAARIDGASTFQSFWHVVLPLMKPIGATVIVFTFISAWNEYLFPLLFLVDPSMQTLTQLPQFFVGQFSNDQTKVLASAVIVALPQIVAYLCLQRLFERGMSAGAIK
ncbi:carbohydrate ABC transporter permease [Populibacterium corticicola]|uniref:Carbohydrate ABC transporter permease n=1 Tax=Populibacterium corticicola TaxID=1812826 RepID=A0ABW5XF58_9MICO